MTDLKIQIKGKDPPQTDLELTVKILSNLNLD